MEPLMDTVPDAVQGQAATILEDVALLQSNNGVIVVSKKYEYGFMSDDEHNR